LSQDRCVSRKSQDSDAAATWRSGNCVLLLRNTHARDFWYTKRRSRIQLLDFCVPHHANVSSIEWLWKTQALKSVGLLCATSDVKAEEVRTLQQNNVAIVAVIKLNKNFARPPYCHFKFHKQITATDIV
jgi:hypothetical protein